MARLRIDADELRRAREASGITSDRELAHRLHLDPATVSRVLSGRAEPGPKFIAAALEKLPTNFESLFVIDTDEEAVVA